MTPASAPEHGTPSDVHVSDAGATVRWPQFMPPPASAPEHKAQDIGATEATEVGPGVQAEGAGAGFPRHTCDPLHREGEVVDCPGCRAGDTYTHWRARAEALAQRPPGPTCGTCGRECLPDGDCYGCEADRWQAQAEALAETLLRAHCCATKRDDGTCDGCFVSAALARLPARAPAERRALETAASLLRGRDWSVALRVLLDADMTGAAATLEEAVDALDAVRGMEGA